MHRYVFVFVILWAVGVRAGVPDPGDVRFTEIMASSSLGIDWVEFTNASQKEVDLNGCKLRVGLGKIKEKTLPKLLMAPGRHVVVATSPFPAECETPVDLVWSGVSMRSSMPEAVEIRCPKGRTGEVIDRVLFNMHEAKITKGHSIEFCEGETDSAGLMPGWIATQTPAFCSILGTSGYGSPGSRGTCPVFDHPPKTQQAMQVGDIEITEVMVKPVPDTPEWIELTNITQEVKKLDNCCLRIGADQQWKELPLDNIKIGPVSSIVLAGAEMSIEGTKTAIVLKGLRLVDTKPQSLLLVCDNEVICQADYDPTLGEVQSGHSICFDYETDPAKPSAKCAASSLAPYSSTTKGVNYGTPFDPAPCDKQSALVSNETQSGGCSVSFVHKSGDFGLLAVIIFGFLLVFRKRKGLKS